MTNPHELINLRGYGSAEKALRKAGLWKLTPQEKANRAIEDVEYALEQASMSISGATDHIYTLEEALEVTT